MKIIAFCLFIAAMATFVAASPKPAAATKAAARVTQVQPIEKVRPVPEVTRFRKSASYGGENSVGGGGSTYAAPPCPRNYLFSCQPNLTPVPCQDQSISYGSAGAYSAPVPTYAAPLGASYGYPAPGFAPYMAQAYAGFNNQLYR